MTRLAGGLFTAATLLAGLIGCRSPEGPPSSGPAAGERERAAEGPPEVTFTDVTEPSGIALPRTNGAEGEKLLPETMGGGAAFFDADNDGDQDLVLTDGRPWPWATRPSPKPRSSLVYYQNDGKGRFTDTTEAAGLRLDAYAMGIAAGDYDNDGWVDLFVTAVGRNTLLRNVQGRFVDVTRQAGVGGQADQWSTCAAWVDVDTDGDLDLFVCNYIRWSRDIDRKQDFRLTGIGRAYGPPRTFEGAFPYLYRNEGGGRFIERSADAGLRVQNAATRVPVAKSLGVAPADFNGDGCLDLVVANDTTPNLAFRNRCDGTFEEVGASLGVAFDSYGNARSAMGIDSGDFRNDGALAYAIGNFANEMLALYTAQPGGRHFADEAIPAGVGAPSRTSLTFGLFFFDYDLDGRLDLLTANGHIEDEINAVQPSQHYAQPPQLFWNAGSASGATFAVVERAGDLLGPMVGRGATFADIDGDGDLDVLLVPLVGRSRLLRNDQQLGHRWIRLKLVGTASNRDAIGAEVEVHAAGPVQRRQVMPTRSYLSQTELPVTFGLGGAAAVERVRIHWPNGRTQEVSGLAVDRLTTVTESPGESTSVPPRDLRPR
jgi:enediyne biosynthesis protein E4